MRGKKADEPTKDEACKACALSWRERERHWFYSFTDPAKLFAHLAEQGVRTTEEYRAELAIWYSQCEQIVRDRDEDPKRYNQATENIRKWTMLRREARTPDDFDRLASELLSLGAQESVKTWTNLWRFHKEGVKISRDMMDEIQERTFSR